MNRIFLAILALFAGIATQVSPAEARVRGETEIGAVLGQRAAARAAASVRAPVAASAAAPAAPVDRIADRPLSFAPPAIPAVRLGPDRAHE